MLKFFILINCVSIRSLFVVVSDAPPSTSPQIDDNIDCLNELPILNLIKIKRSVEELSCPIDNRIPEFDATNTEDKMNGHQESFSMDGSTGNPEALPLVSDNNQIEGRSFYHEVEEKPTKVQKIFQLSVTTFTFLAFGGYLLCLIVQAIKSKGTTYFHPVSTYSNSTPLKKIKVYKRTRRTVKQTTRKTRNLTDNSFENDDLTEPSPDDLYRILQSLAEGYVKIVQIK